MQGPREGRLPRRDCPICGERIWPMIGLHGPVRTGSEHVHTKHPDYQRWSRRTSFYYLIPLLLFVGSIPIAVLVSASVKQLELFTILFSWLEALVVGATILSAKERGTKRFRESWLQEHGRQASA